MNILEYSLNDSYALYFILVMAPFTVYFLAQYLLGPASISESDIINSGPYVESALYRYGVSELQGKRPYMEDRFTVVGDMHGATKMTFYGVYDGHGGAGCSSYCAQQLHQNLLHAPEFPSDLSAALRSAFLATDKQYLQKSAEDGTTALVALALGDDIYVAHAGDSRAVLVQRGARAVAVTNDHKPNRADEKARILAGGGSVVFWGVWRVGGVLAVSRAIGDKLLKMFVISEPEVHVVSRSAQDQFLILASDGVWDVLSNSEAARITVNAGQPQLAAKLLMETAYSRGSTDNITALVLDLR